MKAEYLTRQEDLIPQEVLKTRITIVGAGAIGSFAALTIAKMGFNNITVWDDDEIDPENMNCQFYRTSDIGEKKVVALYRLVRDFTGTEIKCVDQKVSESDLLRGDIVISAVDCMKARTVIAQQCGAKFLIDARMGAEYIMMYTVPMASMVELENYRKSLYSNESAEQERCTAKSTMYTVNLIAGLIGKTVKDLVLDHPKTITGLDWSVKENSAVWFSGKQKLTL